MRHATLLAMLLSLSFIRIPLWAQDYNIQFQAGSVPSSEFFNGGIFPEDDALLGQTVFQGNRYLVLQFEAIPSDAERQALGAQGVELYDYIPNYAYLAKAPLSVSLDALNIRAACIYQARFKIPQSLSDGGYAGAVTNNGVLRVLAYPWPSVSPDSLRAALATEGFQVESSIGATVPVRIADSLILELAAHPGIHYLGLPEPPPETEGIAGRSALRLNLLSSATGIGLDGAGVSIGIGDDGSVNHEDFRGRLFDHTSTNYGEHGDMTAGLAIGAGNIDPLGIGMAPGSTLHLYNIGGYPHITNARQYYQQHGTVITSTSYSEGCGGNYGYTAVDIDRQARQQPELLHIFSAGNSAFYSCSPIYGGVLAPDGYRYGNITGGRKAAKSVLAVANLYYNGLRVSSSSRGPAEDGRIKPDISAFGQGAFTTAADNAYQQGSGTSAAAPSVAGAAAVLVQAYRQQNNNVDPDAALIKAAILNTAEDLGRRGPDYDHGWGRLHAGRALDVIQHNQYFNGVVNNGGQRTHQLYLPNGVKEVRAMLYWADPEGTPVAAKALVNDLDLTLTTPSGGAHRPWVLSTSPHIDSLTRPASPGTDRVNNVEQVALVNPASGTYTIRINGFLLGQGPQEYYIVYTFLKDEITVTYPAGGEHFVPGVPEILRWDAYDDDGLFTVQYSTDGGSSWITITDGVSGGRRSYSWLPPNLVSGRARIRVLRNGQAGQSAGNFNILGVPDFQIGPGAGNTVRLSWAPVPGANQYDIYVLGQYVMEIAGSTSANFIDLPAGVGQGRWYSVRARYGNELLGRRAVAQFYTHYPCEATVSLLLHFDNYPAETHWQITNANGDILAAGGPYNSQAIGSTITVQECLPNGCYQFTIFDDYQNGMCCNFGNGYYALRDDEGNLLASGGQFGSSESQSFCLTSNEPLQAYISSLTPVSCPDGQDGTATVTASGGAGSYSYTWSNGANAPTAGNLSAGSYAVTVSDGQAEVEVTADITAPPSIILSVAATDATCSGAQNGSAFAQASGGTSPFSYHWSQGAVGRQATGLAGGSYTVTATDQNNCTGTRAISIGEPAPVAVQVSSVVDPGGSSWSVSLLATGGTPPYQYRWENGMLAANASGLAAGDYTVTTTDANGCSAVTQFTLQATGAAPCDAVGANTLYEWIEAFQFGSFFFNSGNDGGHGDFRGTDSLKIRAQAGGAYSIGLLPGFSSTAFYEHWRLWVDFNQDGDFLDAGEELLSPSLSPDTVIATVTLPDGLPPGEYGLRIAMKYGSVPLPCEGFAYGEVEDYTLWIEAGASLYCNAGGQSSSSEWIEAVQIGNTVNLSGNNGGYADYTDTVITAVPGADVDFYLRQGNNGSPYPESWRIWADLNQDGDFDDDGELLHSRQGAPPVYNGSLVLPPTALPGLTRLRVSMKFGLPPGPCEAYTWGETEDYGLWVLPEESLGLRRAVSRSSMSSYAPVCYPNPTAGELFVRFHLLEGSAIRIALYTAAGQLATSRQLWAEPGWHDLPLEAGPLPEGAYYVQFSTEQDSWTSPVQVVR